MTGFKDHFSGRAATYAAYRPTQPREVIAWAAALAPSRDLAWDCATGNGQAARGLAELFDRVIATDASADQIAHAVPHERVEYRVATAEASGLPTASCGLVTVAQALHWLDLPRFYAEAKRVLVPEGALAVWSYGDARLDDRSLDEALQRFNHGVVGAYWPPERRMVDEGYRNIPFPFDEVAAPAFALDLSWTLDELAGYLRSWSATARFTSAERHDPVPALVEELRPRWGGTDRRRTVHWPVAVRAGHVP